MNKEEMPNFLYEIISELDSPEAVKNLFIDLCTYKEIENMAQRLYAAKLLSEGKTYQEVTEACSISSATLSRVSRSLQYGSGYRSIFK
ncbi:MAG: TrpR-related protein YerC/YecD [Clostridiaceae bacterium]|nr:TrpR-related protein YerC/YecD [Clostridiaceae bacterium]